MSATGAFSQYIDETWSLNMKDLIQHFPPPRPLCTTHSTRNRTFLCRKLDQPSWLVTSHRGSKPIKHTCIPSVRAHHSLTFGFSLIRFISPSQSSPTYLNVAKIVRSLSKKIESVVPLLACKNF